MFNAFKHVDKRVVDCVHKFCRLVVPGIRGVNGEVSKRRTEIRTLVA